MKSKLIWLFIAIVAILITRTVISSTTNNSPWHQQSWQSLYTTVNLTVQGDTTDVQSIIRSLDVFFEGFTLQFQTNSRLDLKIRNSRKGDTLYVDSLSWELMDYAEKSYQQTSGSIHPGVGSLIRSWGLEWGLTPTVPSDSVLKLEKEKLKHLFFKTLEDKKSILILQDSGSLALGAFSKGFALEVARRRLLKSKFSNFLLEIGGDLVYNGHNPRGADWTIAITDPDIKDNSLFAVTLPPEFYAMATSGGYERFFKDSLGNEHHHILDPGTGQSAKGTKSTTVFARNAAVADMMATWFFIDGVEQAKKVESENASIQTLISSEKAPIYFHPNLLKRKVNLPKSP